VGTVPPIVDLRSFQPDYGNRGVSDTPPVSILGAVVVGAGQAGLASSYHLTRRGIEHVVLERGRVGETWLAQRWDTFAFNTPGWRSHLREDDPDRRADDDASCPRRTSSPVSRRSRGATDSASGPARR
jgi:hypothetical protein